MRGTRPACPGAAALLSGASRLPGDVRGRRPAGAPAGPGAAPRRGHYRNSGAEAGRSRALPPRQVGRADQEYRGRHPQSAGGRRPGARGGRRCVPQQAAARRAADQHRARADDTRGRPTRRAAPPTPCPSPPRDRLDAANHHRQPRSGPRAGRGLSGEFDQYPHGRAGHRQDGVRRAAAVRQRRRGPAGPVSHDALRAAEQGDHVRPALPVLRRAQAGDERDLRGHRRSSSATQGIGALVPRLREAIKSLQPKIIVVDSFKAVHDLSMSVPGGPADDLRDGRPVERVRHHHLPGRGVPRAGRVALSRVRGRGRDRGIRPAQAYRAGRAVPPGEQAPRQRIPGGAARLRHHRQRLGDLSAPRQPDRSRRTIPWSASAWRAGSRGSTR